jgi:hypothetical protein
MTDREAAGAEGGRGGYLEVAGLPTWHEVRGAWSAQAPALSHAGFRAYVPERRGHAHTPDVDAPLTRPGPAPGADRPALQLRRPGARQ